MNGKSSRKTRALAQDRSYTPHGTPPQHNTNTINGPPPASGTAPPHLHRGNKEMAGDGLHCGNQAFGVGAAEDGQQRLHDLQPHTGGRMMPARLRPGRVHGGPNGSVRRMSWTQPRTDCSLKSTQPRTDCSLKSTQPWTAAHFEKENGRTRITPTASTVDHRPSVTRQPPFIRQPPDVGTQPPAPPPSCTSCPGPPLDPFDGGRRHFGGGVWRGHKIPHGGPHALKCNSVAQGQQTVAGGFHRQTTPHYPRANRTLSETMHANN